jgi:hypothetical protein
MRTESDMNVSGTPSNLAFAIFSGVPSNPASSMVWMPENTLLNTSKPMVSSQPTRMNPFVFPRGSSDYSTQLMLGASNPFSFGMPDMKSHFSSFVSMTNINPSFGFGGMMPPYVPFSFGGGHISQVTPTVGGCNPPSSRTNPIFNTPGWSAQMGSQFTSYIPSVIPPSSMPIPTNYFIMENIPLTYGFSLGGVNFMIWETPERDFLHLGETYIILIMSLSCHK